MARGEYGGWPATVGLVAASILILVGLVYIIVQRAGEYRFSWIGTIEAVSVLAGAVFFIYLFEKGYLDSFKPKRFR